MTEPLLNDQERALLRKLREDRAELRRMNKELHERSIRAAHWLNGLGMFHRSIGRLIGTHESYTRKLLQKNVEDES